jgi:hypothetical protein
MALQLPRLTLNTPLVDQNGSATQIFVRWWDQVATTLESSAASVQTQVSQINAALAQAQAAITQANNALTVADNGGSAGAQSGTTSQAGPTVSPIWTNGPRVDLTSVIAGNLSVTISFAGSQASSTFLADNGNYRVQQIISGVETTVFTGTLQVSSYPNYTPAGQNGWIAVIADTSTSTWSGVNFSEASTGSVSYRLDFVLDVLTYTLTSSSLFARRA